MNSTNAAPAPSSAPRIDYWATVPDAMRGMLALQSAVDAAKIDQGLHLLVVLRVSQINGCAYCMNMHATEARARGETDRRLDLLSAWRETTLFTARERAALHWAEALTRLSQGHVSDEDFAVVRAEFSEAEIVNLTLAVATINAWNRFGVGFRPPLDYTGAADHG